MFNQSNHNDNMIKQNTDIPYEQKNKKHAVEEQNSIVVSNKKTFKEWVKTLFRKNKK